MPNPFYEAQDQAGQDPSQAPLPEPAATGSMQPGAPSGFAGTGVEGPKFADGSVGAIGKLRDVLMGQFPEINDVAGDQGMGNLSGSQKLGLLAIAIKNPQGALDLVRQRRHEQLRKRAIAAELNIKMLGTAGEIVKTQNTVEQQMFEARLHAQRFKLDRDTADFDQQLKDAQMGLIGAQTDLSRFQLQQGQANAGYVENAMKPPPQADPMIADGFTPGAAGTLGGVAGNSGGYQRPALSVGPHGTELQFASPDSPKSDPLMNEFLNFYATAQSKSRKQLNPQVVLQQFLAVMRVRRAGSPGSFGALDVPGGFDTAAPDAGIDPNLQ